MDVITANQLGNANEVIACELVGRYFILSEFRDQLWPQLLPFDETNIKKKRDDPQL